jgi:hypothetical protein
MMKIFEKNFKILLSILIVILFFCLFSPFVSNAATNPTITPGSVNISETNAGALGGDASVPLQDVRTFNAPTNGIVPLTQSGILNNAQTTDYYQTTPYGNAAGTTGAGNNYLTRVYDGPQSSTNPPNLIGMVQTNADGTQTTYDVNGNIKGGSAAETQAENNAFPNSYNAFVNGMPAKNTSTSLPAGGSTGTNAGQNLPGSGLSCIQLNGVTSAPTINYDVCASNIANKVMQGAAWILWACAWVFDLTIAFSMNIRTLVDPQQGLAVVTQAWQVLRDLANLCLMFVLLYIAFSTILQLSGFSTKRMLITTIIVAILMNFSFLFASVVIDFSNELATFFYNSINPSTSQTVNNQAVTILGNIPTKGISGIFIQGLGIISVYDAGNQGSTGAVDSSGQNNFVQNTVTSQGGPSNISPWNIVIVGLGGSVLMLVTSFVLLAAAVLFLIRVVVLIGVLMFSAIAIASYALPQTKKIFDVWLNYLLKYAFFAPAYLLMMYLVTVMITSGEGVGAGQQAIASFGGARVLLQPNFAAAFLGSGNGSGGSVMSSLFTFIFLIAAMIGSLIIATKIGVYGADKASAVGRGITNKARDVVVRNSVNRFSRGAAKAYDATVASGARVAGTLSDKYNKSTYLKPIVRGATKVVDYGTLGGAYVARKVVGKVGGVLVTETGKSIDQGLKNTLKAGEDYKAKDGRNLAEVEKADKARTEEIKANVQKGNVAAAIEAGKKAQDKKDKGGTLNPIEDAALNKLQTTVASMNDKEITEQKMSELMHKAVLESLTDRHLDAIMKSDKYGDAEKKGLIDKKFKPIKDALDDAIKARKDSDDDPLNVTKRTDAEKLEKDAEKQIQAMSEKQLELVGPSMFFPEDASKKTQGEFAISRLKGEQAGFLTDKNKAQGFGRVQKDKINEVRGRPLKKALAPVGTPEGFPTDAEAIAEARKILRNYMNPDAISKMGDDDLKKDIVIRNLDTSSLIKIKDNGKSDDVRSHIRSRIATGATAIRGLAPGVLLRGYTAEDQARILRMDNWLTSNPKGLDF